MSQRVIANPLGEFLVGRGIQHTHAEIAKKLGISRQAVHEAEKRGLEKIRRALARQGVKSISDLI